VSKSNLSREEQKFMKLAYKRVHEILDVLPAWHREVLLAEMAATHFITAPPERLPLWLDILPKRVEYLREHPRSARPWRRADSRVLVTGIAIAVDAWLRATGWHARSYDELEGVIDEVVVRFLQRQLPVFDDKVTPP
jgi:hypothetical protein